MTPATCPTCGSALPADTPGAACPKCLLQAGFATGGAPPADRVPSPEELAPKFPGLVIESVLGRGGMGVVYRARHKALDRDVALKVLPATLAGDAAFAERFQREARALAKLQHPNIVGVHDFGESDGLFWLVMEFVDGTNIRQAMKAGTIGPKEALAIVPQICDALQYAHEHGVVHRDIKPENVLLDRSGRVKVADFGLAKMMERGETDRSLTGAGQVMGTPHYMAPEQWERPKDVDHRADIYSLGVVFYEMLTGELPVGRFAAPSKKSDVDARIDEIVLKTLEREREARYQRAEEVKTDVGAVTASPTAAAPTPAPIDDAEHRRRATRIFVAGCLAELPLLFVAATADNTIVRLGAFLTAVVVPLVAFLAARRGRDAASPPRPLRWGWWVALAASLLCGGPLALAFVFVGVTETPTPVEKTVEEQAIVTPAMKPPADDATAPPQSAAAADFEATFDGRQPAVISAETHDEIARLWSRFQALPPEPSVDDVRDLYPADSRRLLRTDAPERREDSGLPLVTRTSVPPPRSQWRLLRVEFEQADPPIRGFGVAWDGRTRDVWFGLRNDWTEWPPKGDRREWYFDDSPVVVSGHLSSHHDPSFLAAFRGAVHLIWNLRLVQHATAVKLESLSDLYSTDAMAAIRATAPERLAALGPSGGLGFPMLRDDARGGRLSEFLIASMVPASDGRHADLMLEHLTSVRRLRCRLARESSGDWRFTADPVAIE
jgi:hypothetical protein